MLLPFFVSFVIRSLAWQFILSDDGIVISNLERLHLLPPGFHILSTSIAVIAGIAYNSLPFMVLPLYVSLEKIDRNVVEAARDLYATPRQVFRKVILPLSIPGIFAGFLLTFIPAVGDYVNNDILGGPNTTMIGNVIQRAFLNDQNYPLASSLSFILMVGLLIGILIYARVLGTRQIVPGTSPLSVRLPVLFGLRSGGQVLEVPVLRYPVAQRIPHGVAVVCLYAF